MPAAHEPFRRRVHADEEQKNDQAERADSADRVRIGQEPQAGRADSYAREQVADDLWLADGTQRNRDQHDGEDDGNEKSEGGVDMHIDERWDARLAHHTLQTRVGRHRGSCALSRIAALTYNVSVFAGVRARRC